MALCAALLHALLGGVYCAFFCSSLHKQLLRALGAASSYGGVLVEYMCDELFDV